MDQAADQLGIDPVEIRKLNLVGPGGTILPGKRGLDADLAKDLAMVTKAIGWEEPDKAYTGTGIGVSASDAGAYPVSDCTGENSV